MENMEKVENLFLLKVENIFAGCGNGCMWWCRQGKVGEGVINLSTNFLNAPSLIRKEEKCYLRMDFTSSRIASQGRGEK